MKVLAEYLQTAAREASDQLIQAPCSHSLGDVVTCMFFMIACLKCRYGYLDSLLSSVLYFVRQF